jgi:hypothetical protein
VWAVDSAPAVFCADAQVDGRDVVGVPSEAAPDAAEMTACGPVPPRDVPAAGAGLAGVGGIHQLERYPGALGFVAGECGLLGERPTVQGAPLGPMSPYPPADALEFFEGDAAAGAFGLAHHMLADLLIDIGHHPGLPPGQATQPPPRRRGALGLQTTPLPMASVPQNTDGRPAALTTDLRNATTQPPAW